MIIRHRAFRHEKRVRGTPLDFSDLLRSGAVCSLVLRTHRISGLFPRDRFRTILHPFSETHFFTTICTKKAPAAPPKTPQKLKKLKKTWPLNAPTAELYKKAPSGRGQALKA